MNGVAISSAEDRAALFGETAARMGLASAVIVEKDFWVCFTLHHLFSLEFPQRILFKGGTSLSKAFGLIDRFSEDIDLAFDRADLGFSGENDPLNATGKARKRKIAGLASACADVVRTSLRPRLRESFACVLGTDGWALEPVDGHGGLADLHFEYPRGLPTVEYGNLSYIRPMVRLEIGARSDHDPVEQAIIASYAAQHFPQMFRQAETEVRVLSPERTFWEKVTIFHAESHRPPPYESATVNAWRQMSRHASDIVMMARKGIADRALHRLDLLQQVVRHKMAFFSSGWANYTEAAPGTLRLAPAGELRNALREDYREMRSMFPSEPPSFDDLMTELKRLEDRINGA